MSLREDKIKEQRLIIGIIGRIIVCLENIEEIVNIMNLRGNNDQNIAQKRNAIVYESRNLAEDLVQLKNVYKIADREEYG